MLTYLAAIGKFPIVISSLMSGKKLILIVEKITNATIVNNVLAIY